MGHPTLPLDLFLGFYSSTGSHACSHGHTWKPLMAWPSCGDHWPSPAQDQDTAGHTKHVKSQPQPTGANKTGS